MRERAVATAKTGVAGTGLPFNPFVLDAHAQELLSRRVMLSPVLVVWHYRVTSRAAFIGWLATKEILLSEARMSADPDIGGVRYGGTYRLASEATAPGGAYQTVWGYTTEAAMQAMHRLMSDASVSATIIQLELLDFASGLKKFIAEAGDASFSQDVLVSAAAEQL